MDYCTIATAAAAQHLVTVGAFHPGPQDRAPAGCGTLVLLAPQEPGFWAHLCEQPEAKDDQPDPMDRWSKRAIDQIARSLGAKPLYPFGGPPYHPFIDWALTSGSIHASPVSLLVHNDQGLWVSFRGALAFRQKIDLSPPRLTPCLMCHAPCETACPVDALSEEGYDTAACHGFLDTPEGQDCLQNGCKARRSCPVSQSYPRSPAQSAYHMAQFHK